MIKNFAIYLSLFFCLKVTTFAQTKFFWQYTAQNGLISSKVKCVAQDTKGYLWIGTNAGISRFDGLSFSNYNSFDNLSTNNVEKIIPLANGELMLLHSNGELTSYKKNTFTPKGFQYDTVIDIRKTTTNQLLIITAHTIFIKHTTNKEIEVSPSLAYNERIKAAAITLTNEMIIITNKNIISYNINNSITLKKKPLTDKINNIAHLGSQLLTFTNNKQLVLLDKTLTELDRIPFKNEINKVANENKELLISTKNGLFSIALTNTKLVSREVLSQKNGLLDKSISCYCKDSEGTIWIGSEENGLLGLAAEHFPIYKGKPAYGKLNTHIKVNNKNFLVYQHAVVLKETNGNEKISYQNRQKDITAFFETTKGEKWIGTTNGLYITFPGTNIEYAFKELKGKSIKYIRQNHKNRITIVTDQTVLIYNQETNRITDLFIEHNKPKFNTHSVLRIHETLYLLGDGNVAIVDLEGIKYLFDWNDPKVKNLTFSALTNSKDGFWIGTQGKGVILYKHQDDYSFFSLKENFSFKYVNSMHLKNDILWTATQIGIAKINIPNKDYKLYNQRHFTSINFNSEAAFVHTNAPRQFYFMSKDGLVEVSYERFNTKSRHNLKITSFNVSGREQSIDSVIALQYGKYPINISYEALSLCNKTYYQYKLSGIQNSWSNPTTQNNIEYSDLVPGEYIFTIRLIDPLNHDKVLDEQSLTFKIAIPFWKTTLFYIIVGAGTVLIIFALYLTRIVRLRIQKRKLQSQVDRKTFQLSVQKKHLEQFSYSLSHDLKNPINNIKGLVEILEEERSDEIIHMLSESTEILETKLLSTLESIKKSQANTREITKVSFQKVFERVNKSLLMLIRENKAEINGYFDVTNIQYEESLVESIIYNLVSNAIKYRHPDREPMVEIITQNINEFIRISVTDNGLGLDVEKERENIFSIFKRVHTNAEGTGIGLYMIKQMVEINGGSIDLESTPGEGTTFHVYLKNLSNK